MDNTDEITSQKDTICRKYVHTETYDHNFVLTNRNITLLLFLLLEAKEKQKLVTPALLLFLLLHISLQWSSYHNLAVPDSVYSIPDSVLFGGWCKSFSKQPWSYQNLTRDVRLYICLPCSHKDCLGFLMEGVFPSSVCTARFPCLIHFLFHTHLLTHI